MKKILIIEDDCDILEILEYVFNDEQFEAIIFDEVIPLSNIQSIAPDIILLDNWIGDKLGSDLCEQIKSDPKTTNIPVILLSAHHNLWEVSKNCQADSYICKPFDIDVLYRSVMGFTKE